MKKAARSGCKSWLLLALALGASLRAAQTDPSATIAEEEVPTGAAAADPKKVSTLGPIAQHWRRAVVGAPPGIAGLAKTPLLLGLGKMVELLDFMGEGLGDYLKTDLAKMRSSKAPELRRGDDYKLWLLGEMPVHAETKYRGYVDDSAFMGQLWVGRQLEFWAELLAGVLAGRATGEAADQAYRGTLKKHHNFMQIAAFRAALKRLPDRDTLIKKLQGEAADADFARELEAFVSLGQAIAKYQLVLDKEIDGLRAIQQRSFGKKQ